MRALWLIGIGAALLSTGSHAETFQSVQAEALRGHYQAQRNLAYGYSAAPYSGQDKNQLLACAWRIVIVHSGSKLVNETDVGNRDVYCGQLNKTGLTAAQAQARTLYRQIYKTAPMF